MTSQNQVLHTKKAGASPLRSRAFAGPRKVQATYADKWAPEIIPWIAMLSRVLSLLILVCSAEARKPCPPLPPPQVPRAPAVARGQSQDTQDKPQDRIPAKNKAWTSHLRSRASARPKTGKLPCTNCAAIMNAMNGSQG